MECARIHWFCNKYIVAGVAGMALGIGFIAPFAWPLVFIGSALLAAIASSAPSPSRAVCLAGISGVVGYGLSSAPFVWTTLPLDWLGVSSLSLSIILAVCVWTVGIAVFAVSFSFCIGIVRYVAPSRTLFLLLFPFGLVLNEWIGPLLYSIVHIGPPLHLSPDFTVGSFSYLLADNTFFIQGAWLGGIYMLAACIGFIGSMLVFVIHTPWSARIGIIAVGLGVAIVGTQISSRSTFESREKLHVALITTYHDASMDFSGSLGEFSEIIRAIAASPAQLVVLPEDSRFLEWLHENPDMSAQLIGRRIVILDSATVREPDGNLFSRTERYDLSTGMSEYAYKTSLAPFGEYMPYFFRFILTASGQKEIISYLLSARDFHIKPDTPRVFSVGETHIATGLCDESASPDIYRAQVRSGATVVANLASHAWFNESKLVHTASVRFAKVRAVESRRFFVRAANAAPSFVIDPYGALIGESEWNAPGILEGDVFLASEKTPYVIFGPWLVWMSCGVLLMCGIRKLYPWHTARWSRNTLQ